MMLNGGAVAPASLYRPTHAMTGALEWMTPNSTPNNHFPSTNFKVLAPNLSAHGGRAINGQLKVFPSIYSSSVQLVGPMSFKSTQECKNKSEENMIGPMER
jgi:hypothetical protein